MNTKMHIISPVELRKGDIVISNNERAIIIKILRVIHENNGTFSITVIVHPEVI